jgi:hypothetical protein
MPSPLPCPSDALDALEVIASRAFGIEDGYQELNAILVKAIGLNLFEELGGSQKPMRLIVADLRVRLEADGTARGALDAAFLALPGCAELRGWVQANVPDLLPQISAEAFEKARPDYEQDRLRRRVGVIKGTLDRLSGRIALPAEGRPLARAIIERLEDLNDYKSIHDALHNLQMAVLGEFQRVASDAIDPGDRKEAIALQIDEMELARDRIRRQFDTPSAGPFALKERDRVLQDLGGIVNAVRAGDPEAQATADAAANLLRGVLRQQMSLFDSRLVEASEKIPFVQFAAILRSIPQPDMSVATGAQPALLTNVGNSFDDLSARLLMRQTVHRLWQQVEATLLNVEELLRGTSGEIEIRFHWQNLRDLLLQIDAASNGREASALLGDARLAVAEAGNPQEVRSDAFRKGFGNMSRTARVRFQRADSALLEDCALLGGLAAPLRLLLGEPS